MADTTPTLREAAQQALEALEQATRPQRWPFAVKQDTGAAITPLRAALAEQAAEQAVPAGYALVPVEPTAEMCAAPKADTWVGSDYCERIYRAMIAAAPPAPARQEPLTEEQVRRGWSNISLHPYVEGRFIDGVRFAERAHGITAAPAEGGAA